MANVLAESYGIENYLEIRSFDQTAKEESITALIETINNEMDENYLKYTAVQHYKNNYGFVPPFVLTKILTFGAISRYYGLMKQADRQKISRYFRISDKLLKQILINLTMARNISAHADRLFSYRSKFLISFKNNNSKSNLYGKNT